MAKKTTYEWGELVTPKKLGARPGEPSVTILPNGAVNFNKQFCRHTKKQLEGSSHCIHHYNPKNPHAIIFEFTAETQPPARKMTGKDRDNISVSAKGWFNHVEVGVEVEDVMGKYTPKLAKLPRKGDCWFIDLEQKKSKG